MWSGADLAASKAVRAVAASARAGGCIEASSALVAAACTVEAVAKAAEACDHATLHRDPEYRARRAAASKCIAAQLGASRAGRHVRRPRDACDGESVALRNVAMHEFGVQVAGMTGKQAKQFQRGRKFKHSAPGSTCGHI